MEKNLTTETQSRRETGLGIYLPFSFSPLLPFFLVCLCVSVVNLSCGSKSTDLRTLVPAETLVYLETNDLAAALQPIVDNKAFEQVAKSKPDLSVLKGVQLAVAVTGFETREEKLTDEHSIGRIQPHFVTVVDTHAWNYQAVGFAEQKLGAFVANIYDSEPTLDKTDKNGGKYFTWTAKDGRKAYAFVIDSLIYFGNDESAIDNCLAVKRGEADGIVKTGKVAPADSNTLASGYVSPDGIAQIANIVGLKFASEAGEDSEVQSAIAGILPQLLRRSISEIAWITSPRYHDQGIQDVGFTDRYSITTNAEVTAVLRETLLPSDHSDPPIEFLPLDTSYATFYNFEDPQIAWRSVLLVAQKQTDPLAGKVIGEFSGIFFEPYGIHDAELFLSSVDSNIITANLNPEGEKPVVIAKAKDMEKVRKSLSSDLKPDKQSSAEVGIEIWKSDDGDLSAAFVESFVIVGDSEAVLKCVRAKQSGADGKLSIYGNFDAEPKKTATTVGFDSASAEHIAEVFGKTKPGITKTDSYFITETRFTKTGIERRTVSDFGLIGSIIAQFAQD